MKSGKGMQGNRSDKQKSKIKQEIFNIPGHVS